MSNFSTFNFHLMNSIFLATIGLNNEQGEISYYSAEQKVYKRYCFNMDEFLKSTAETLLNFR